MTTETTNGNIFEVLERQAQGQAEGQHKLRLLGRVAPKGGSPSLRQLDDVLCNAARRMIREQAGKEATTAISMLSGALARSRAAGEPPRIDDLEIARELATRASAAYAVLGELSEDALYDNVSEKWEGLEQQIHKLIGACLHERAKILKQLHRTEEIPIEEGEEEMSVQQNSENLEALIAETERITQIAAGVTKAVARHPATASLIAGM